MVVLLIVTFNVAIVATFSIVDAKRDPTIHNALIRYNYSAEEWTAKYTGFVQRVHACFPKSDPALPRSSGHTRLESKRLLCIDLTAGGSSSGSGGGADGEGDGMRARTGDQDKWEQLTSFLDLDGIDDHARLKRLVRTPFPQTDVFVLTFGAQALRQFKYLVARAFKLPTLLMIVAALSFWPLVSVSSYDQCTRSCRAAAGGAGDRPLPGIAEAALVADGGARMMKGWRNWWTDPATCSCYDAATGVVAHPSVPRLHPANDWRWSVPEIRKPLPARESARSHC